jgi:hypothetical protein
MFISVAVLVVFVFHYSKKLDSICFRAIVNLSAAASSILVIVSRVYLQVFFTDERKQLTPAAKFR